MKSFPSKILTVIEKKVGKIDPILFYGNESGLILELIKSIFNVLKKKIEINEIQYLDHKNLKFEEFEQILINTSLFSKASLIVIKNPQERLIKELESIKRIENFLIVNGEGLRANSKLKLYFDNHKNFTSIPCYKLSRTDIKKIIDDFIKINRISFQNEAYEFLIDNIGEDYLIIKNELKKLSAYKDLPISLIDLQKLISQNRGFNADNYFFNCATGNSELILKEINSSNTSINDSYEILISLKRFLSILTNALVNKNSYSLDDLVKIYLPKYLFLKKDIFKNILAKTNLIKIERINTMIQKTEYLLRRNSEQHREILERLLLNLAKILK